MILGEFEIAADFWRGQFQHLAHHEHLCLFGRQPFQAEVEHGPKLPIVFRRFRVSPRLRARIGQPMPTAVEQFGERLFLFVATDITGKRHNTSTTA
nr:hypothetical protein [Hydrogenophilus thermoluteolus]